MQGCFIHHFDINTQRYIYTIRIYMCVYIYIYIYIYNAVISTNNCNTVSKQMKKPQMNKQQKSLRCVG